MEDFDEHTLNLATAFTKFEVETTVGIKRLEARVKALEEAAGKESAESFKPTLVMAKKKTVFKQS